MKRTMVNTFLNEVILYGGLPLRRGDVYIDALKQTGSTRGADLFAFGQHTTTVNDAPLTLDEFWQITRQHDTHEGDETCSPL